MDFLRTPDDRFSELEGWEYQPHYVTVDSLRVAYYDIGAADAPVALLLHGEPTWSYLYRSIIPPLVDSGLRVIAVDLVGFGRSDKPTAPTDYTYQRHVDWLTAVVVDHLNLHSVTLLCHDWGGMLGLRLVAAHPGRFSRVIAANTFLPNGSEHITDDFLSWREFSQQMPIFRAGGIVDSASLRDLPPETIAAYDAPFPDESYKAGARRFPLLVPISPTDPASAANRAAWDRLRLFDKPFLTLFSDSDPVTAGKDVVLQQHIPGAAGQPHHVVHGGHFLQEDAGPAIARAVIDFIASTPS